MADYETFKKYLTVEFYAHNETIKIGTDLCLDQDHPLIRKDVYSKNLDELYICPDAKKYSDITVNYKDDLKTNMKVRPCTTKDNSKCITDSKKL